MATTKEYRNFVLEQLSLLDSITYIKGGNFIANESKKDFNAMLKNSKDIPKFVKITDKP